ncbi:hypothetical protein KKA01_02575 [Patescibacteria group bacterium]|nr:hypothetical protein [Patescibacteria group bacterium]
MSRNILITIMIIAVLTIQLSFIDPFTTGIAPISIILLLIALLAFRLEIIPLLWWSFGIGAIHEIFSILPFGTFTIITVLTATALYFLLNNVLTNKSLFPFVLLAIVGSAIYNLLLLLASTVFYAMNSIEVSLYQVPNLWTGILQQALINGAAAFVLFLLIRLLTRRFQNQFLVRN